MQNIPLGESWTFHPMIAGLFRFTFITNTGAAFGMFPQLGSVLMVIAIIVVIGVIAFSHHLPITDIWVRISMGLILGGAMGNLSDRILRSYVVDFVDIGFWPIFNIADLSIVLGVAILSYCLWEEENKLDSSQRVASFLEK